MQLHISVVYAIMHINVSVLSLSYKVLGLVLFCRVLRNCLISADIPEFIGNNMKNLKSL